MIKWIKETYSIPTQPGWIGLVLALVVLILFLEGAA